MTAADVLRRIVAALDHAGIPHMLTGSFAGAYHGEARATQDIDIVIAPTADQLLEFVSRLPDDEYYLDVGTALSALRSRSQFNIIDKTTGWKIDLIVRRERRFSIEEFGRRQKVELAGVRPGSRQIPPHASTARAMNR